MEQCAPLGEYKHFTTLWLFLLLNSRDKLTHRAFDSVPKKQMQRLCYFDLIFFENNCEDYSNTTIIKKFRLINITHLNLLTGG